LDVSKLKIINDLGDRKIKKSIVFSFAQKVEIGLAFFMLPKVLVTDEEMVELSRCKNSP